MLKGLHHIGVRTTDMDRSLAFYQTIGMSVRHTCELPNGVRLGFLEAGSAVIELIQSPEAAAVQGVEGVVAHIAFAVKDIDTVIARLREAGIAVPDAGAVALFGLSKNVFFEGPNGEKLELFEEGVQAQ